MSHPQLKNELPGGSKMSYRIIKEEYSNKNTTTHTNVQTLHDPGNPQNCSSFFKCKNKMGMIAFLLTYAYREYAEKKGNS